MASHLIADEPGPPYEPRAVAPAPTAPTSEPKPTFRKPSPEALIHRFKHHPPRDGDQAGRYQAVREAILAAALRIVDLTPCSPEQTRALNALDNAMMLANAAIARNEF